MTTNLWIFGLFGYAMFILGMVAYERGRRKGLEEAERIFSPVLELASKWAKIHLQDEEAKKP